MDDWLQNPAIQAGVAPPLAALCVAVALRRGRLLGLAVGAAFATAIKPCISCSAIVVAQQEHQPERSSSCLR